MNKIIPLAALAALSIAGCKTSEANYRAAYETAIQRSRSADLDSTIYANIRREARPSTVKVGAESLPLTALYVSPTTIDDFTPAIATYNIVVAGFKQLFNAKSMMQRLRAAGYADAFVVETKEPLYYVVASATDDPATAARQLRAVKEGSPLQLRDPFPWVLRPAR